MKTFSKRNRLRSEYSGYGVATLNLRNRILQLYGAPYSANEYHFGLGNDNWIHQVAFGKDLQMHFGRIVPIEDFRNETVTSYNDIFDFIELYFERAKTDLDSIKRRKLHNDIVSAFVNSGSVYEFNSEGYVTLKVDEPSAEAITRVDEILSPFEQAQELYRNTVDGLITRSKHPKDIVGDMYIIWEDFLNRITGKDSYENAIKHLKGTLKLHPTQIHLFEKLRAYRGDVWGAAHAGNGQTPDEGDALWYLESLNAQINYLNSKISQSTSQEK